MSPAEQNPPVAVNYTIKELLLRVEERLVRIEEKIDTKADKTLVDVLAQKIESVSMRIPGELIKEHSQVMLQIELFKQHNEWVDQRVHDMESDRERASTNLRWAIGLAVPSVISTVWILINFLQSVHILTA